jgi:hypothetical protein
MSNGQYKLPLIKVTSFHKSKETLFLMLHMILKIGDNPHNMNPKLRVEKLDQKVWMVNEAENILNFYVSRTSRLKKVKSQYG